MRNQQTDTAEGKEERIIKALQSLAERLGVDEQEAVAARNRLAEKQAEDDGLDSGEAEQLGYEDGFSAALRHAINQLTEALGTMGINI